LTARNGVLCPMHRSGNAWDNAAIGSFFSLLGMCRSNRVQAMTRRPNRRPVSWPCPAWSAPIRRW